MQSNTTDIRDIFQHQFPPSAKSQASGFQLKKLLTVSHTLRVTSNDPNASGVGTSATDDFRNLKVDMTNKQI